MTGSVAGAPSAAAMTTVAAVGVQRAAWLLLVFPIAGAIILLLGGKRSNSWGHLVGVAMPVASFVYGAIAFFAMLSYPASQRSRDLHLYSWIPVAGFKVSLGLLLDPLSICFVLLITGVGSLIRIFAVGYMANDPERRRFFGYMNLFLAAMLLLVLADNYLGLYAGWEGVGLASYLLIGFWQFKPAAATAAKKAFIANRVGDAGLSLAIMLMFAQFGTVTFAGVFGAVHGASRGVVTALGLLLLLGACGKSAQLPLQSWLLDAMEGPTPVSALIHAATMVTAGVYLIVRSNPIFNLSPDARLAVTIVGAATLLFGAIIGCAKDDIKKALAGSTMSQIGYMMLAAGLGPAGYAFAIAHLLAHGFFKAGLFLGAGSVKHEMDDEVDMRRFGGLRKVMPITFVTFTFGYLAIIGVPPFSGFFTKDPIIEAAFDKGGTSGAILGTAALLGAGITAFYMTRVMFMTFAGERRWDEKVHPHEAPPVMTSPMVVLALGSLGAGGFLIINNRLVNFLAPVVGVAADVARDLHPGQRRRFRTGHRRGRDRLGHVRAARGPGDRSGRQPADGGRAQGAVRQRHQRVGADAAGPVAHQAVGLLRQPRHRRPGQHPGRHDGRHVRAGAQDRERVRPVLCAADVPWRGAARGRAASGEDLDEHISRG